MKSACIAVLACLPLAHAQSLQSEFESLKQRRDADVQKAIAPIDKKFAELANQLLAKAIQKGELDAAATIRQAIPQGSVSTASNNASTASKSELDIFLESKSWKYEDSTNRAGVLTLRPEGKINAVSFSNVNFPLSWEKDGPSRIKIITRYDGTITYDYRSMEKRLYAKVNGITRTLTVINPN